MIAKKKLIYIWEYGSGLGHIGVFLPAAKTLLANGWDIKFYIPSTGVGAKENENLLKSLGYEFYFVPGSQYRRKRELKIKSHIDILLAIDSFANDSIIDFYFEIWEKIFEEEEPDLVVCDFAVLPALIARLCKIKTLIIDAGYYYPSKSTNKDFSFVGSEEFCPVVEKSNFDLIAGRVNRAITKRNKTPLITSIADIYACDQLLIVNFESLSIVKHNSESYIGGNIDCLNNKTLMQAQWSDKSFNRPKIICYLHLDQVCGAQVFQVLMSLPWIDFIIYSPALNLGRVKVPTQSHIKLFGKPVMLDSLLTHADAVICHGGASLISQCLWRGVPLLIAPSHLEQLLNAKRVQELGAGLYISGGEYTFGNITRKLLDILSQPIFKLRARAFALENNLAIDKNASILNAIETLSPCSRPKSLPKPREFFRPKAMDVIFLSYDEPNADNNWIDLLKKCPWAKRVHGVKGFDASHKAAAELADTERFVLVDGDNKVDAKFFNINVEVPPGLTTSVWQWCSLNAVNGLTYAAGGLKVWPKAIVKNMRSHEAIDQEDSSLSLDFWDQPAYAVFTNTYSVNHTNASPYQAYRAGYREGVKYGLAMQSPGQSAGNIRRIAIWASVGIDKKNGGWSILGARHGLIYSKTGAIPSGENKINDYSAMKSVWKSVYGNKNNTIKRLLDISFKQVEEMFPDLPMIKMPKKESRNFKAHLKKLNNINGNVFDFMEND